MPNFWNTRKSSNDGNTRSSTVVSTTIIDDDNDSTSSDLDNNLSSSSMRLRQRRRTQQLPPPPSNSNTTTTTTPSVTNNRSDADDDDDDDDDDHDHHISSVTLDDSLPRPAAPATAFVSGSSSSASSIITNSTTTTSSSSSSKSIHETNIPRLCVAFLASITTGGTTYAFGLYGNALKKNLHLTQSQLDTISTANFCAGALSWIPGLLVDYFGTRFGISMGGMLGSIALMIYWHVAKHGLHPNGWIMTNLSTTTTTTEYESSHDDDENHDWMIVATLSSLGVAIFLSCALITGSVFKIIVNSCGPGSKGSAVGVAKAYVGLGAGAYACFFEAIRQPETSDLEFLPMCAIFFIFAAVIPSWCILPTKQQDLDRQQLQLQQLRVFQEAEQQREQQQRTTSTTNHHQRQQQQPPSSSSSSLSTNMPDVTTPRHFQILFSSLILMACVIVGSALLTLYHSSKEHTHHVEDVKEDDDIFEGTNDDQYTYPSTGTGGTNTNTNAIPWSMAEEDDHTTTTTRGPNYPLALFLLFIWIAPIVSLIFLPQGIDHSSPTAAAADAALTSMSQGVSEDISAEERETLLDSDDNDRDASEGNHIDTKQSGINARNKIMSSSPMDLFAMDDVLQQQHGEEEDVEGNENTSNDNEDEDHLATTAHSNNNKDKNLLQMLMTPAAWLMLFTTTILVGGGTVETNNLGQMVESLRFPDIVTPAALALFSVAQSLSRALTGAISEITLNSWTNCHGKCCGTDHGGVPRPVFLILASVAGFIAHSLLALSTTLGPFVIGVFLSGAAFGMVWPLMVLIVGEVFGTAHVAANYMFFDGFTSAGGTLLLSKVVAQEVYERHVMMMAFVSPTDVDASAMAGLDQQEDLALVDDLLKQESGNEDNNGDGLGMDFESHNGDATTVTGAADMFGIGDGVTCYGQECFRMTHIIIAVLSLLCVFSSVAMQYVTRHIYNNKSNLHRH